MSETKAPQITCRDFVELVTDYLEGQIAAAEQHAINDHLGECPGCAEYVRQMRLTIAATGRLRLEDLPAPLEERLLAAFRSWRPA